MRVRCPNCGLYYYVDEPKTATFESRVKRPFKTSALAPTMPQPGIVRETPVNLPTLPSHVLVPLYQSLIDGFFAFPIGIFGGIGLAILVDNASPRLELTNWGLFWIGLGSGVSVSFLVAGRKWPTHLGFVNSLLYIAEEIFQTDFDGDEEIGEPEPVAQQVKVEITENGVPRQIEDLDIDPNKLKELARLIVLEGKSFSERTAAEAQMSRDEEWVPLRNKFINRGWAAWRRLGSTTQGVGLLKKGQAVLGSVLSPALPATGGGQNVGSTHPRTSAHDNYERFEHIER